MHVSMSIWIVVVSAAIVGGGLGIYFGIRKNRALNGSGIRQEATAAVVKDRGQSWETLMNAQKSLDQLRITDILEWANGCRAALKDGDTLFLFKATRENVVKTGYQYTRKIDSNTNVIACVINTKSGEITHVQLFTFGEMSDQLVKLFAGYDYGVITL